MLLRVLRVKPCHCRNGLLGTNVRLRYAGVDSVGTCVQCSKYVDASLESEIIGPLSVATLIDDRRDV
jgi:hypothetical protein